MSKKCRRRVRIPGAILACGLGLSPSYAQEIATVAGGGPVGTRPALSVGFGPTGIVVGSGTFIAASSRVFLLDSSGNLTVIGGNGGMGSAGDGGPATAATLSAAGLDVDGAGNVYFADTAGHRIRRIDAATGIVATVAGNGLAGFSGDGGPAMSARLNEPSGLGFDAAGNIFIVDHRNRRIRRVDAVTGTITTVAGTNIPGPAGDGGPATSAWLIDPVAVAVDGAGNYFISDGSNVRRVDAASGIISRYAGQPNQVGFGGDGGPATGARLNSPRGLALDGLGNLFIADSSNQRIRRVDAATGIISTVAGNGSSGAAGDGGPAAAASFLFPSVVGVTPAGDILIGDGSNRVRRVDASTGLISTVAGNGSSGFDGDGRPATETSLSFPWGTAVDSLGNVYIADLGNNRVRRVDATSGLVSTWAGNGTFAFAGDGGPAVSAGIGAPIGLAVDAPGNVFIADQNNRRVRRVDAATGTIATVAGGGTLLPEGVPATSALLFSPQGVAVDAAGNLFIADPEMARVFRVDSATGLIDRFAGAGAPGFGGDGGPAANAALDAPSDVALDLAGNAFIADRNNHRIRRVDAATGIISTIAGNGINGVTGDGGPATSASLSFPFGVEADRFGNVFITDGNSHRVRRVGADGIITTLAGTGVFGFRGDGGAAILAELASPRRVRADSSGNVLISDVANGRIRKVTLSTDVSITVDDGVSVVSPGQALTYSIVAHNNAAAAVSGVTVTATLSGTLFGVSWSCVASAGASCGAGGVGNIQDTVSLPGGGTATYTLHATVVGFSVVTNTVSVAVPAPFTDPVPGNNAATDTDLPPPVLIQALDNTIVLTNAKATQMQLLVYLNRATDVPVSVHYQTENGTAVAGSDYWAVSGTLTFVPGNSSLVVPVTVKATGPAGSVRTFFLNLSASSGADIGDPQAQATIVRAH